MYKSHFSTADTLSSSLSRTSTLSVTMSLAATLRPSAFSFSAPATAFRSGASRDDGLQAFQYEPNYINLTRMVIRFTHLVLLTPSPTSGHADTPDDVALDTSPLQQRIQSELWSPLPFYRTKWLHNIEGARHLLLQLERAAQGIKVQRTRQIVQQDLAGKRTTIKRLRHRVEEIGREVEGMGEEKWQTTPDPVAGETLWDIVQQRRTTSQTATAQNERQDDLKDGRPVQDGGDEKSNDKEMVAEKARDDLFNTSSSIRRRDNQRAVPSDKPSAGKSTGVSTHEKSMHNSAAEQEALTSSMVSLAAQLKQQVRAFQFSLDQDKGLLDRAIEGLEGNITGLDAASKTMQTLKRMSEGEGWWGRMKLYAIIFAMWVFAILLVFVMPKLRF